MSARLIQRLLFSLGGVALVTFSAHWLIPVNATTVGFAYLLLVLVVASTWGFTEAAVASLAATITFNFYFLPPVGALTIADPQNWVALFSFLATALIASRLSDKAERRAEDAIARRQDVEHLYAFSRAILLIDESDAFSRQLAQKLADIFPVSAAALYDRRKGEIYRAGPADFNGLDEQLRDAAWNGSSFADPERRRVITAVRLGSEPIAALALEGAQMPDSVLQGIANLVAIGLERSRAQDLAHQVEAGRRSEQLRTTLLDAMAHEFKTPLTAIKAATTALLADPGQTGESRSELLTIADEEADHLKELIDDAIEMARLDNAHIDLSLEMSDPAESRAAGRGVHADRDRGPAGEGGLRGRGGRYRNRPPAVPAGHTAAPEQRAEILLAAKPHHHPRGPERGLDRHRGVQSRRRHTAPGAAADFRALLPRRFREGADSRLRPGAEHRRADRGSASRGIDGGQRGGRDDVSHTAAEGTRGRAEVSAGRILIVDDEPQLRRIMRATLSGAGYEVEDAHNGEEALEKVREYRPDLVLLDINMPGMGGLAACRAIRADTAGGHHHADGAEFRSRQGARAGCRGGRLRHQAVQHPGASGAHTRGPEARARRPRSRRAGFNRGRWRSISPPAR